MMGGPRKLQDLFPVRLHAVQLQFQMAHVPESDRLQLKRGVAERVARELNKYMTFSS